MLKFIILGGIYKKYLNSLKWTMGNECFPIKALTSYACCIDKTKKKDCSDINLKDHSITSMIFRRIRREKIDWKSVVLIFIVLDKIMNKFLWLKIVLIMYINIKGDECKNHVIVNCILPLLTLWQCIFALVWAAFIEKFKKNSKHVCYHSCQVYLSKIKTLQEQRKTIFL